ncbi:MAG: hypothetical protein FJ382_13035 [Verrucomicrobia bacterium]|nr:hypothetical protein [Verrucomicrobiota bacterium]
MQGKISRGRDGILRLSPVGSASRAVPVRTRPAQGDEALFLFIGTALFAYYTARPALLPAGITLAGESDKVFPHFINAGLPVGVTGLVIAAIFAAAQSTLASSINCAATLTLCDLYRRYLRPEADARESMRVLRMATLGFGLAGTAAALAMIRVKSALDIWWQMAGIFSGGMLGLFLLGMISRHAKNAAAAAGVAVGLLLICWMSLSPLMTDEWARWRSPFHSFMITVIGTVAILLVGLTLTLLTGTGRASAEASPPER